MQNNPKDGKFKLQFVVDEEDFNQFESIRKNNFSSTSKQYLLKSMFDEWMNRQALAPLTALAKAPAKKAKEGSNEQRVSTRSPRKRVSSWTSGIGKA